MNNKNVVCRPCKEQNNWEIKQPNGQVSKTHYYSKNACVAAGRKMAEEFGCELVVNEENNTMNKKNRNNDIY